MSMDKIDAWKIVVAQIFWVIKWPALCLAWFKLGALDEDAPEPVTVALLVSAILLTLLVANGWLS